MNSHYPLVPFRIERRDHIVAIMRQYPLATVISGTAGSATTTLLPLIVEEDRKRTGSSTLFLEGHLDRNNEHAGRLERGEPVSFVFKGPDAYASPDLYPSAQLPGWLYVTAKGDGLVDAHLEERDLRRLLVKSTRQFGDATQEFELREDHPGIDRFIHGILGFRIRVMRLSAIAKLAQDKGPEDSALATEFLLRQTNAGSSHLFRRLTEESLPSTE